VVGKLENQVVPDIQVRDETAVVVDHADLAAVVDQQVFPHAVRGVAVDDQFTFKRRLETEQQPDNRIPLPLPGGNQHG